jgi:transcriptional regulator with XRE-family HTH domain
MTTLRTLALAELLKQYRAAAGLTQDELAERAHLSVRAISDLERGVRRAPHKDTLLRAARRARGLGAAVDAGAVPTAAVPTAAVPTAAGLLPSQIPAALTPLIGREREEAAIVRLLSRADA